MLTRLILLFAFSFLIAFSTKADTFIVTSNADSGTGTLRQALTLAAANGNTVKDYIYFNLPDVSEAGRTITLLSILPPVPANIAIDASTQPGQKLGVSDAKVTLKPQPGRGVLYCFVTDDFISLNNTPVEIYGFFITGFYESANYSAVIVTTNCKLTFGAPGKGNLVNNTGYVLQGNLENCTIQSNIIGLDKDGETVVPNGAALVVQSFNNLLIGGDTPQEGNVISGNDENITLYASQLGRAYIKNNLFGTNYNGTKALHYYGGYGSYIKVQEYQASATIEKNTFSADLTAIDLVSSSSAIVKGNFMGTDKTQTYSLGHNNNEAVSLNSFCNMLLGGETEAEQNVITNYNAPVFSINFSTCNIVKNHFYCNGYQILGGTLSNEVVNITKLTNNYAYGNAPAGSRIQLYYSEEGCSTCNPKQWFADAYANSEGHWEYSGPINGKLIISATVFGNTIAFAPTYMKQSEAEIKPVNCNNVGSIEIVEKREGRFQFIWKNEAGTIIGTDQKVNVSAAGRYFLEINEDGPCPVSLGIFDVGQYYVNAYPGGDQLNCNKPTGTLSANYSAYPSDNVQFKWEDKNGVLPVNGPTLQNLPAGDYYLTVSNAEGCKSERVLYQVLPATSQPTVDVSLVDRQPANCGQSNGSIKNIKVTGNVLSYSWQDSQGNEVGNTLDLINQPSGSYKLLLTYDYNCPPLPIQTLEIETASDITVNIDTKVVNKATCNIPNGSITGITINGSTNALTYKWENELGQQVGNTLDLTGVKAGKYRLIVSGGACMPVPTALIEITEVNGVTIDDAQKNVIQPTCQNGNGSITNIHVTGATKYTWYNFYDNNKVVSHDIDLLNKPPGTYYLVAENDNGCSKQSANYTIDRPTFTGFSGISKNLKDATCDENNGSIEVIFLNITGPLPTSYKWVNSATGQIFTTTAPKLTGIDAGTYDVYGTDNGCEKYIITYSIGRVPKVSVNTANLQINDYSCTSVGSITGIQLSLSAGQYKAQWIDENTGLPVCDCVDLLNANPGKYRFKVTNLDGSCIQLFGPYEIKAINAVSLVTTNVDVRSQTACELGQITGLTSPDATSFAWRRKNSIDIISTSIDLLGVPAGDYELTISNANCSRPVPFSIAFLPPVSFSAFPATVTNSCHAFPTGTITVNTDNAPSQPIEYRWMNSNNERVGYDKTVQYLPAGTYKLYVRDNTGCESPNPIQQVTVGEVPEMVVVFGNYHDIYCGVGKGSIDASTVTGGKGNYIYTWTDASGTIIAPTTQRSLSDLSAGSYKLVITDFDPQRPSDFSCNRAEITYTIKESDQPVPPPVVNNKEVNRKGNTTLTVQDAYPTATYRLYDSETSNIAIGEAQGGNFTINVTETKTYWVELTYGTCLSLRSKATIVLGLIADAIPNAFSPNGDGVNDYWVIKGIEESTLSNVKVFNRQGQMVFQSRGYAKPFDGTYMGKQLPAGVYYYIIERQNDKPLSGHVTIIR